ncbi:MAG: hypothetical protein QW392_10845 [Candidatus Jordarchaeales archaeon]
MLIDKDGRIRLSKYTRVVIQERFSIYWEGFVYGHDKSAGEPSIKAFHQAVEDHDIHEARIGLFWKLRDCGG